MWGLWAWWFQFVGISLAFIGAVLLLVAQQPVPGGQKWRVGLVFLCVGFGFQLVSLF